jgi:hypothetical protein
MGEQSQRTRGTWTLPVGWALPSAHVVLGHTHRAHVALGLCLWVSNPSHCTHVALGLCLWVSNPSAHVTLGLYLWVSNPSAHVALGLCLWVGHSPAHTWCLGGVGLGTGGAWAIAKYLKEMGTRQDLTILGPCMLHNSK